MKNVTHFLLKNIFLTVLARLELAVNRNGKILIMLNVYFILNPNSFNFFLFFLQVRYANNSFSEMEDFYFRRTT